MMDLPRWLAKLASQVQAWSASKAVEVHCNQIEPPAERSEVRAVLKTIMHWRPSEIEDFYALGARGCHVCFSVNLPWKFPSGEDRFLPRSLVCGLTMSPLEDLPGLRQRMLEYFDSVPPTRGIPEARFKPFLRAGIPLSVDPGGNLTVLLGPNDQLAEGVYLLLYELLGREEIAIRIAPTFFQWLGFLEKSCYVDCCSSFDGPWHNGSQLVADESMSERLRALIESSPRG